MCTFLVGKTGVNNFKHSWADHNISRVLCFCFRR